MVRPNVACKKHLARAGDSLLPLVGFVLLAVDRGNWLALESACNVDSASLHGYVFVAGCLALGDYGNHHLSNAHRTKRPRRTFRETVDRIAVASCGDCLLGLWHRCDS